MGVFIDFYPFQILVEAFRFFIMNISFQISYDIVEDILVQGDRMRETLQQLQDAVYLTKVTSPSLSLSDCLLFL